MKQKRYIHESAESIRTQEVRRLRKMAAEAAARGERGEAYRLDKLADAHAQTELKYPKTKYKPVQLKLWGE